MTAVIGNQLAQYLETFFIQCNDVDDSLAISSADCNYENYDDFVEAIDLEFFSQDFREVLSDVNQCVTDVMQNEANNDICEIFNQSTVNPLKFNLLVWYILENAKRSDSSQEEVQKGVFIASSYITMCAMKAAQAAKLFQEALYEKCLRVLKNCCRTFKIGEVIQGSLSKKSTGFAKRKGKKGFDVAIPETLEDGEEAEIAMGPPKIPIDDAVKYIEMLTTQLYGFLNKDSIILDSDSLTQTLETVEELGRLDIDSKNCSKALRANSVREFRCLDKFVDRYSALLHVMVESKYNSRTRAVYSRIIRPRLALIPFPDESNKSSKIPTERKRAGDLAVAFVINRLSRNPENFELSLIKNVLEMIYYQCPELQEFRQNISGFIGKILTALPYKFLYDFVQTMNILSKMRSAGVKSLSIELASSLIFALDFSQPDPGPIILEDEDDEEEEHVDTSCDEEPIDEEMDSEEDDEEKSNKSRRKKSSKNSKRKSNVTQNPEDPARCDAASVMYTIIYLACLDKSGPQRLHGANAVAKILGSEQHRKAFQECCEKLNTEKDKKFGEVDEHLNETLQNSLIEHGGTKKGKASDLMMEEQAIIRKFNKLKLLNKGEARVERNVLFMILRKLATDDKALVRKAASYSMGIFLSYCDEKEKFEVIISLLGQMCRDRATSVRKTSSEVMTELMLRENIIFKDLLSSTWLNSLILMLDDAENDIQEHSTRLIMRVISPLLEKPSDLTWALLETIESKTMHRQYFMSTLKEAATEGLIKQNVMETMKQLISSNCVNMSCAWMVLSQLSVVFKQNIDYAIEAFYEVDVAVESKLVKYCMHVIVNNVDRIKRDTREALLKSIMNQLINFSIHPSHARDLYHCAAKLMDGIGDQATGAREFHKFGDELLVSCFDTIVASFDMFREKEEWQRRCESQEKLLIVALNIASEVFLYSPILVPSHERLAKTLSLIVNSNDRQLDGSLVAVNPEMPLAHVTRPLTQMSEVPKNGLLNHEDGAGVLFSDNVRAVSVVTLANMIIAHDKMLRLMPMLVKQLQVNPSHEIRSNIIVAIGDICETYKTDRYAPVLAASLCDPSVIVRRHAINEIARLVSSSIFRFTGEVMIRMMLAVLDANEDVRNDAKLYISEVLRYEIPEFFPTNFVQYMFALTQARRVVMSAHDEDDRNHMDMDIGGGDPLARCSRIAIYNFMIESLDDRARFEVKKNICQRVINPIINGEFDFGDHNVQCLLDDALLIMSSNEMQVKMEVGKNPNENCIDDPSPEKVSAASDFMRTVYLEHYNNVIIPAVLNLREFLNQHRSPLQRKCQLAIRMICLEHDNDVDTILKDNRQLKDEMVFEMQRVKERTDEANRILDGYMKKVLETRKKDRRMPQGDDGEMVQSPNNSKDQEMVIDTPNAQKNLGNTTPKKTPHVLSPKTLKKIRRSVGMLITGNELAMNPMVLDETKDATIAPEEESTIVAETSVKEADVEEQTAEDTTMRSRSRRRKTPIPEEENVSEENDENRWKKPKLATEMTCEKPADVSTNVTLRSSRRSRKSERISENENKKAKICEVKDVRRERSETPLVFDETVLNDGRHCSTPILNHNNQLDLTFELNVSVIDKNGTDAERKSKKRSRPIQMTLGEIHEADENE